MAAAALLLEALFPDIESGKIRGKADLNRAKADFCRARGLGEVPSDSQLLAAAEAVDPALALRLRPLLRTKSMRTLSGVAVVAVMTSPAHCPHGRCTFCPGGVEAGSPQAYTGFEPAAQRGARAGFDSGEQVAGRLKQLAATGHRTDKVDLIVMGGTFTAREGSYQEDFVKGALDAMNGAPSVTLAEAARRNETAPARCIGLTVETKPDWCKDEHVRRMLDYGTTRVEIGAQCFDDAVLTRVHRGHTVQDTVEATRAAKDAGLKVNYHIMPGLPAMTPEKDLEGFRRLFDDPAFRPDQLKVYPTLVLPQTPLYAEWKRGEFDPYGDEEAARVVASLKELVPPYVRIQRVDRDIPSPMIAAGVMRSNLRQLALADLARRGKACLCIRCREAGHRANKGEAVDLEGELAMRRIEYESAGGRELFLELVDGEGALHAFARARLAGAEGAAGSHAGDAFLRELRVVGRVAEFGADRAADPSRFQHTGLGAELMDEVERTAFDDWGAPVVRVTAGVGVRGYYRKLGYSLEAPYMVRPARRDER
jgi:elongator complex protein 3